MKRSLSLLCFAAALITCLPAHAEVLDFSQALQRALDKSPEFKTQILKTENAQLETKNAKAALWPTIDLQASHSYSDRTASPYFSTQFRHLPWSNQAGLSIQENLYDNGITWRRGQTAELQQQVQEIQLAAERSRLQVKVAKAFFDYSLEVAVSELQKQQIQTLNTQFRTIEGRYRQGMSSNRDYLQIKAQGQSAEIGFVSQEIQVEEAKRNLRVAIGESSAVDFTPISFQKTSLPESTASSELAARLDPEGTYEFRVTKLQERISEITFESARRLEWPKLSIRGSYEYTVPQYLGERFAGIDDPFWNLQVMLVVDYRLWDWGSTQRTRAIAANQQRIETEGQYSERLRVQQDIEQIKSRLQLLNRSYKMSQEILKANQAAYESLNRGYRDGKISYLELITSLNTVYSSRSQNIGLKVQMMKSFLDAAHYEGKVDDAIKTF